MNSFKYKGITYRDGDTIIGSIQKNKLKGKLFIEDNGESLYFCQSVLDGNEANDKKGQRYSWVFHLRDGRLTDDVEIFNKATSNNFYEEV